MSQKYWDHTPTAVVEDSVIKVLWDFNIFTDHHLTAHHPDIAVLDKQPKTVQITDIAVPSDGNVSITEKEKRKKY